MPPLTTGSMAEHLKPGLMAIVGTEFDGREAMYSRLYNVKTTRRNFEEVLGATGLPIAVMKPQGVDIQRFDPRAGNKLRLDPETFALGCEYTEEAWDDDLYGGDGSMLRASLRDLVEGIAERVELEAHIPFTVAGFTTAQFSGTGTVKVLPGATSAADDAFFSDTHQPISGAQGIAQSNIVVADFNTTSYNDALVKFRRLRDDQGKRIGAMIRPEVLVGPPEMELAFREVVQSGSRVDQLNPGVTNVNKGATSILIDAYLDDVDSWFIRGSRHYLWFLWRWRPRQDTFDDRSARVMVHVIYCRFVARPVHYFGWLGSLGV